MIMDSVVTTVVTYTRRRLLSKMPKKAPHSGTQMAGYGVVVCSALSERNIKAGSVAVYASAGVNDEENRRHALERDLDRAAIFVWW